MKVRFLWEMDDHRRRVDDKAREKPGYPNVSAAERLEQAVRRLSGPANEPVRGARYPGVSDEFGIPRGLRRDVHQQEHVRKPDRLDPIARRLDDLTRELDQRQNETRESGRAAIKALVISMTPERAPSRNQRPDRAPFDRVDTGVLDRDREFARPPYEWIRSQSHDRGEPGRAADHLSISAFDPVQPQIPSACHTGLIDTRPSWSSTAPFAGSGLEAVSQIVKPELPPRPRYMKQTFRRRWRTIRDVARFRAAGGGA